MKVFSFVKKVFALGLTVSSNSITGALNCVSMNNQECRVRPKTVDINSNNPMFYPFSIILRELIFANFGQFRENFFREKSKIHRFVKISSREISKSPSFAKINSVSKFAKNRIFAYS